MKEKLDKDQLLSMLVELMNPAGKTEKESDDLLAKFCAGCPDPMKARWLIVECLDPMTNEELVDRALAMPLRLMADVPLSELPAWHSLRTIAL